LVSCSVAVSVTVAAALVAVPTAKEASASSPGIAVESLTLPPQVGHEQTAMVLVGTALIGVAALVRRRV
jgi:hypothetical protein